MNLSFQHYGQLLTHKKPMINITKIYSGSLSYRLHRRPLCLPLTFDLGFIPSSLHGTLAPYGRNRLVQILKPPAGTSVLLLFVICINYPSSLKSCLDRGMMSSPQEVFLHHILLLGISRSEWVFISNSAIWSLRWINKICKYALCKLDTCGCCEHEKEVRVVGFLEVCGATTLPGLLISCASAAQCGTSSSHCLLFPPTFLWNYSQ